MGGDATLYLARYCYYLSRRIAASGIFYRQIGYAVRLYDHAMRNAIAEHVADGELVWMKAIGRNLRRADDALAQVVNKFHRVVGVAFAGAVRNDGAS